MSGTTYRVQMDSDDGGMVPLNYEHTLKEARKRLCERALFMHDLGCQVSGTATTAYVATHGSKSVRLSIVDLAAVEGAQR